MIHLNMIHLFAWGDYERHTSEFSCRAQRVEGAAKLLQVLVLCEILKKAVGWVTLFLFVMETQNEDWVSLLAQVFGALVLWCFGALVLWFSKWTCKASV